MTKLFARFTGETIEQVAREQEMMRGIPEQPYPRLPFPMTVLPWTMDELPGTTWRNVWTHTSETVEAIKENRYGVLGPDPDIWINAMFSLGLWRKDQFCIEHWVRVDHLSALVQVAWASEQVASCRRDLLQAQQHADEVARGVRTGSSPTYQKFRIEMEQRQLDEAQLQLSELAASLGVVLSVDVRNVGAQRNEQLILL